MANCSLLPASSHTLTTQHQTGTISKIGPDQIGQMKGGSTANPPPPQRLSPSTNLPSDETRE